MTAKQGMYVIRELGTDNYVGTQFASNIRGVVKALKDHYKRDDIEYEVMDMMPGMYAVHSSDGRLNLYVTKSN